MSEFTIITKYFKQHQHDDARLALSIGDDAAVFDIATDQQCVVSLDTLIKGIHYPVNTSPFDIGYKSLAVSLSDMAAMGAEPKYAMLSLAINKEDDVWLEQFAAGFFQLINDYQINLIGGDTVAGAEAITTVVHGVVSRGQALTRSHAQVGDVIYISGAPGEAGMALQRVLAQQSCAEDLVERLNRPTPRVALGLKLHGIAHACIDVSDGLLADLEKICEASQVGATLYLEQLPVSEKLLAHVSLERARELVLTAGDDYELCFTVSPEHVPLINQLSQQLDLALTQVGVIHKAGAIKVVDQNGKQQQFCNKGYEHFTEPKL